MPINLQHVVKEIIDVNCPEGVTFSERSLGKSIESELSYFMGKTMFNIIAHGGV